jgi:tRNA threonylcarbamoyladenosine biosynthesis protein TsaE
MSVVFDCRHLNELPQIAGKILSLYPDERIFIFRGELGAGKTTLIKAICKQLQVSDPTNSPSFAIVNEYNTTKGLKLYHFDFYRLKKLEEVYDIGYEEYFYSGNYCFIEWPELIEEILPEKYVEIKIEWDLNNDSRSISLMKKTD